MAEINNLTDIHPKALGELVTWLQQFFAQRSLVTVGVATSTIPVGGIIPYAASAAPTGFLICDGSAVGRDVYPDLFAVLNADGLPWGIGDGSTTFNIPDLRGRVAVGWAPSGGHSDVAAIADTEGVASVSHRRPKHNTTNTLQIAGKVERKSTLDDSTGNPYYMFDFDGAGGWDETPPGGGTSASPGYFRMDGHVGVNDGTSATDTPAYAVTNFIIKI